MNAEQILKLVNAVSASDLSELKYEGDGIKLTLKKSEDRKAGKQTAAASSDCAAMGISPDSAESSAESDSVQMETASVPAASAKTAESQAAGNIIISPLVGTFYAAPAEDAEPFVKVGDRVEKGQVLAIIEAMKLMNEIESDFAGTVAEILVENGQAVEYGQPLFVIR